VAAVGFAVAVVALPGRPRADLTSAKLRAGEEDELMGLDEAQRAVTSRKLIIDR
jgi:hypothetical protein